MSILTPFYFSLVDSFNRVIILKYICFIATEEYFRNVNAFISAGIKI